MPPCPQIYAMICNWACDHWTDQQWSDGPPLTLNFSLILWYEGLVVTVLNTVMTSTPSHFNIIGVNLSQMMHQCHMLRNAINKSPECSMWRQFFFVNHLTVVFTITNFLHAERVLLNPVYYFPNCAFGFNGSRLGFHGLTKY